MEDNGFNVTKTGTTSVTNTTTIINRTSVSTNIENDINKYYPRNSIQRIIYINDTLYTLSRNLIKATDMNTMEPKGSIKLD